MPVRLVLPLLVLLAWPASAHAQTVSGPVGDFGDVAVGARSAIVYLPVSADDADVSLTAVAVAPGDFSLGQDTCTPATVTTTDDCFVGVRFTPTTTGERTSTLTLSDANGPVGTIALTGMGVTPGTGPTGATGPRGATGAQGPPGPRGLAGRAIQSTCTTRGRPRRTSCRIVVLPDDTAATAFRVRLLRAGRTVARGSAAREGRVRLRHRRALRRGRYTLAVRFEIDGRTVRARQQVRVR